MRQATSYGQPQFRQQTSQLIEDRRHLRQMAEPVRGYIDKKMRGHGYLSAYESIPEEIA